MSMSPELQIELALALMCTRHSQPHYMPAEDVERLLAKVARCRLVRDGVTESVTADADVGSVTLRYDPEYVQTVGPVVLSHKLKYVLDRVYDPSESDPSESDPSESDPSESDPSESDPSESDPSESDPSESDPDPCAPGFDTESVSAYYEGRADELPELPDWKLARRERGQLVDSMLAAGDVAAAGKRLEAYLAACSYYNAVLTATLAAKTQRERRVREQLARKQDIHELDPSHVTVRQRSGRHAPGVRDVFLAAFGHRPSSWTHHACLAYVTRTTDWLYLNVRGIASAEVEQALSRSPRSPAEYARLHGADASLKALLDVPERLRADACAAFARAMERCVPHCGIAYVLLSGAPDRLRAAADAAVEALYTERELFDMYLYHKDPERVSISDTYPRYETDDAALAAIERALASDPNLFADAPGARALELYSRLRPELVARLCAVRHELVAHAPDSVIELLGREYADAARHL